MNGPLHRLCTKNHSNKNVHAVEDNLNSDLDNATTWFIQNCKPGKVSGYCMVLERTEDKLLFKSGNIDVKTRGKTNPLGIVLDSKLKFDHYVLSICCKVSAQINALNSLKNILPLKTKESLYRLFIQNFYYCN